MIQNFSMDNFQIFNLLWKANLQIFKITLILQLNKKNVIKLLSKKNNVKFAFKNNVIKNLLLLASVLVQ
jgi:hypothetical protein